MGKLFITGGQRLWDENTWTDSTGTQETLRDWNDQVGEDDYVYVLGDFSFGCNKRTQHFVKKLNGREIVFLATTLPTGEAVFPPGKRLGVTATGGEVISVPSLVYITTGHFRKVSPTGRITYYNACLHRYALKDWWGNGDGTLGFCLYDGAWFSKANDTTSISVADEPALMLGIEYKILPRVIS